ncbi:MAG: bifunctional diaminohydroxyphosphoribosylaminopyrimidine deaminase/5-amino-6-(5-phosphoribosylamino)uracil reductase RibD [Vulcanimicrobiaceae bacterium]
MDLSRQARLDRLYLERALELAARGLGNTSPNPVVGAVLVRDGVVIGEGYHHRAGAPHAEVEALRAAGNACGATLYVSLEPCNHVGKTPPCSDAVIDARISRVVVGSYDPDPRTAKGGVAAMRRAGIDVAVIDSTASLRLNEPFTNVVTFVSRPYLALKMAASADGYVAERPNQQQWLTGEGTRRAVRERRIAHDAVMVGAGTVRVDNPQLTVRPPHLRLRPYRRIVVCEAGALDIERQIFQTVENYERTMVVAPGGARGSFSALQDVADVVFVGDEADLDLNAAMRAIRERGIQSVLCEGGPTLAARLLKCALVDRVFWFLAPVLLEGDEAVAALNPREGSGLPDMEFDSIERLGDDVMLSGMIRRV